MDDTIKTIIDLLYKGENIKTIAQLSGTSPKLIVEIQKTLRKRRGKRMINHKGGRN